MTDSTQVQTEGKKRPFLVPPFIFGQLQLFKEVGIKAYIKGSGKWVFIGIILFYLVRDVTLYIILPYMIINGLIGDPGPTP